MRWFSTEQFTKMHNGNMIVYLMKTKLRKRQKMMKAADHIATEESWRRRQRSRRYWVHPVNCRRKVRTMRTQWLKAYICFHCTTPDDVARRRVVCERALTLLPPIPLRLYASPYWSNPPFLIFDIRALARMSKIKNDGLDQYGAGPFKQQQFGTAGVEGVNTYDYL